MMLQNAMLQSTAERRAYESLASRERFFEALPVGHRSSKASVFIEGSLTVRHANRSGIAAQCDEASCVDGFRDVLVRRTDDAF